MSLLYPDRIKIIQITMDVELKVAVEAEPIFTKAYVEVENRLLYSRDGTMIRPHTRIFIPNRKVLNKGVRKKMDLCKGDMVILVKVSGETPSTDDQIRKPILMVTKVGHQRSQDIELLL